MVKKQSRVKLLLAVIVIAVIISALAVVLGTQLNQGRVPGVKAGDVFIYEMKGSWSSNDPNVTVSEGFKQINMTEYYKVTVTEVDGPKVSINTNWRFDNGTEFNMTGYVNIDSGTTYPSDYFSRIYAANLQVSDILRPSGMVQTTVNETYTKEYASGITRQTNRVEESNLLQDAEDPTGSTTWERYVNFQFDKQTGILVQLSDINIYSNPQLLVVTTWTLKESNVWAVS